MIIGQRSGSPSSVSELLQSSTEVATIGEFLAIERLIMTQAQHRRSYRIARRAGQQGAPPVVPVLAMVNETSTTEPTTKLHLLKCKRNTNISTFNIRTFNTINQLPELASAAAKQNIDIICIQEHSYIS